MANKQTVKQPVKQLSVGEFKAWIQGIEELQDRTWIPDKKQWKLIRKKIDSIIDTPVQPNSIGHQQSGVYVGPATTASVPQFPSGSSSLTDLEITPPSPAASQMLSGEKRKTPDVDTADGNFTSSFV